jgi:hypothetical protein
LAAGAPVAAATVEEVISKHVEAKGGQDAWNAIESMRITGSFTAFSQVSPFTLHREREQRYHIDHVLDGKLVVIGYDGNVAWWDNHWYQEGAQKISGPDLGVVMRETEFTTPLFDYEGKGFAVKFLEENEIEGIPAIGIELTRPDESVEKWYLDPDTYLELARLSPGSDFGRATEQQTFYDDFREVEGVQIPFFTETQWYTRDRVMVIDSVEVNVDIDDALFSMPAPPGMGPFMVLDGSWKVSVQQRNQPEAPWNESERESTIESLMGGAAMRERFTSQGNEVIRVLSFDRFQERYRVTEISGRTGLMDVREGEIGDDGRLVVTNVESGTTWSGFGMTFHARMSIFDVESDSFAVEFETSIDGGENWFLNGKAAYTRAEN